MGLYNAASKANNFLKSTASNIKKAISPPSTVNNSAYVSGNKTQRGDVGNLQRQSGLEAQRKALQEAYNNSPSSARTRARTAGGTAVARQGIAQKSLSIGGRLAKAARPAIGAIKAIGIIGAAKILGIATAFVGLFAKPAAAPTLPDWVKDVGEASTVKEAEPPPFKGGQSEGVPYRVEVFCHKTVRWPEVKTFINIIGPIDGLEETQYAPWDIYWDNYNVTLISEGGAGETPVDTYQVRPGEPAPGGNIFYIQNITRMDGQPDTGGDPPGGTESITTTTTPNYNKIEPISAKDIYSGDATVPAGVTTPAVDNTDSQPSPLIPQSNTSKAKPSSLPPSVSKGYLPSPTATPKPLPTVTPKPEKSVDDISEPDDKEVIAPPVISTNKSIRADGTSVTTTRREATEEELRQLKQTRRDALETVDTYREQTQFRGGIDNFVPFNVPPSQPGTVEETTRTPALPVTPASFTPPSIPNESSINDDPKPDAEDNKPPFVPPPPVNTPSPECKGCSKKILDKMDALNLGLQGADLTLVQQIHSTVHNASHGLEKIQGFAETAWQASGADKVLNVVGTVASLHNAAMLSQNAAQSMGEVVNNGLALFNIRGFDGQPINVNETIGGFITDKLAAIFGEANLQTASEIWLRLNRIHMAVSSVVWSIQGTKNALLEADEITGGHVAKIGNSLQEQGLIEEDTYDWMNPQPNYQQPFRGLLGKIDSIEDMTNRVSSVVSTGLEVKESTTELVTNSDELVNATNDFLTAINAEETTKKAESTSPEIDRLDTIKYEPAQEA